MAYYSISSGEAFAKRGILKLKYPVEKGLVVNWDDADLFLNHLINRELRATPEEHPILMTETVTNTKENREKITQVMFERFGVPAFYLVNESVLSLLAAGLRTGVVVDSGETNTQIVPIYELQAMKYAVKDMPVGGADVTEHLSQLLAAIRSKTFATPAEKEQLRSVKHSFCFVSQDYSRDSSQDDDLFLKSFELPDGQVLEMGKERFTAPEVLFQPKLMDFAFEGLPKQIVNSIQSTDKALHDTFYQNIVLSGGNTCFPGIKKRLEKDLSALDSSKTIKVLAPNDRAISAWIGGSILSSSLTFENLWITKEEYEEHGPQLVHYKCIH